MAANAEQPSPELRTKLRASRAYWETNGVEGAPLVMPGADLRCLDLREQVLASAELQGADLRNSLLDSAVLVRGVFDGARMSGTSLFSADASKASFADTQLTGTHAVRSKWRRALLARADLTAALLDNADLRGAEFVGARLDRASLVGADLRQAILLRATFAHADLRDANLDGAAAEARTFRGALGVSGIPLVTTQSTPRRRQEREAAFEVSVRDHLREAGVEVLAGFEPGPDLVAVVRERWFAAIEVSVSADRSRLFRLADRADMIVVPNELRVRSAMNGTPVARLWEAHVVARELGPPRLKPFGAAAVLIRQAARLRPYLILAGSARNDPSFLSRLSVYLDTREPLLLNGTERAVAERAPAHLDGGMAARGAQWAEHHREELDVLMTSAAQLRQGRQVTLEEVTSLARRALELEYELAEAARG